MGNNIRYRAQDQRGPIRRTRVQIGLLTRASGAAAEEIGIYNFCRNSRKVRFVYTPYTNCPGTRVSQSYTYTCPYKDTREGSSISFLRTAFFQPDYELANEPCRAYKLISRFTFSFFFSLFFWERQGEVVSLLSLRHGSHINTYKVLFKGVVIFHIVTIRSFVGRLGRWSDVD